jgi:hypothetical protein
MGIPATSARYTFRLSVSACSLGISNTEDTERSSSVGIRYIPSPVYRGIISSVPNPNYLVVGCTCHQHQSRMLHMVMDAPGTGGDSSSRYEVYTVNRSESLRF